MKRNYTGKLIAIVALLMLFFSCKEKTKTTTVVTTHQHNEAAKYTCPMHPQIIKDEPGKCPICGMDLVPVSSSNELSVDTSLLPLLKPVNEQVISTIPTIRAEDATRILSVQVQGIVSYDTRKQVSLSNRVAGRIERMYIKYNYQTVSKGQLIMEIYSPDLAAAQRELIYISRNDNNPSLLQKARQRLSLLGMQPAQISQVERTGKVLYRVPVYSSVSGYIIEKSLLANQANTTAAMPPSNTSSSGGMNSMGSDNNTASSIVQQPTFNTSPVLVREGQYVGAGETIFTVYQANNMIAEFSFAPALASEIKRGQRLVFHTVANPQDVRAGTIGLIEPVQKNGQSFTIARVYLSNSDLHAGQLLSANIPVVKKGAYWLPEAAVLMLGKKAVVFKKEDKVFVPKEVQAGIRTQGLVQIQNDISDWQVAKNASFLVDSESFIKLTSSNNK